MPLRDHFRPPLDDETQWEGFHGGWPMMIVAQLSRRVREFGEPPPTQIEAPPGCHGRMATTIR